MKLSCLYPIYDTYSSAKMIFVAGRGLTTKYRTANGKRETAHFAHLDVKKSHYTTLLVAHDKRGKSLDSLFVILQRKGLCKDHHSCM